MLLMTGFKPVSSVIGSKPTVNCATTLSFYLLLLLLPSTNTKHRSVIRMWKLS